MVMRHSTPPRDPLRDIVQSEHRQLAQAVQAMRGDGLERDDGDNSATVEELLQETLL